MLADQGRLDSHLGLMDQTLFSPRLLLLVVVVDQVGLLAMLLTVGLVVVLVKTDREVGRVLAQPVRVSVVVTILVTTVVHRLQVAVAVAQGQLV